MFLTPEYCEVLLLVTFGLALVFFVLCRKELHAANSNLDNARTWSHCADRHLDTIGRLERDKAILQRRLDLVQRTLSGQEE